MTPISPELVLVDAELAATARTLLPEPNLYAPRGTTEAALPRVRAERNARRTPSLPVAVLAVFAVMLAAGLIGHEEPSERQPFRSAAEASRGTGADAVAARLYQVSQQDGRVSRRRETARTSSAADDPGLSSVRQPAAPGEAATRSAPKTAAHPKPRANTAKKSSGTKKTGGRPQRVATPSGTKVTGGRPQPTAPSGQPPADGAAGGFGPAPIRWDAVRGAASYLARVYRRGSSKAMIEIWTPAPLAELPTSWLDDDGKEQRFTPGEYRWAVYPVMKSGSRTPAPRAARTGTFVLGAPR